MKAIKLLEGSHLLHFMGIGGVGMAGVAYLLKARGYTVTGCDKYESARTKWLEAAGIPVLLGHDPAHLEAVDRLVLTPAVPATAPERLDAEKRGLPISWRGNILASLVNAADGIAVCGTHGKTTTATFTTRLLAALGEDPSWCIGGETGSMPVAGTGNGPLVVEADESDGTLAAYKPRRLVLNAVDFDHLEHFASPEAYFDCYRKVLRQTLETVFVCADQPRAVALARTSATVPIVTFGWDPAADVSADAWPELASLVCGRHNVTNALAAISVALARGHSRNAILSALPSALAELPDRRFQPVITLGTDPVPEISVYTDYAHHPAELACAMAMARETAPSPRRVRVLFQPHRYSRTKALCREFPPAFSAADEIVLVPIYPAFEEPLAGGDIADLYAAFRPVHPHVLLARTPQEAWRHLYLTSQPGDLILIAGAGDVINLLPSIRSTLVSPRQSSTPISLAPLSFFRTGGVTYGGGSPTILGQGSNTWFSDCATDAVPLRAPSEISADMPPHTYPAGIPGASLLRESGLQGLSFMAGIPGTLGGWTKMNAGAFGHSISEAIQSVHVRLPDATCRTIPASDCGFAYRSSRIPGLIEAVTFLGTDPSLGVKGTDPKVYLARRKVFPPRTCGSVFKNLSPSQPAGKLLEGAGAKNLVVGGARVWQEHANVIVAGEDCTSSDILALARLMARAVFFKYDLRLEPEIRGLEVW